MQTFILTLIIFAFCFAGLALGLFFSRPQISGSCGRRKSDAPLMVDGKEVELDCLCEATGIENACSGITEDEVVQALQKFKEE